LRPLRITQLIQVCQDSTDGFEVPMSSTGIARQKSLSSAGLEWAFPAYCLKQVETIHKPAIRRLQLKAHDPRLADVHVRVYTGSQSVVSTTVPAGVAGGISGRFS